MEFGEQLFLTPEAFVEQFGIELGSNIWTVDEAATRLAVTLSGIRADADLIGEELEELVEQSGDKPLVPGTPEFTVVLRLATRGILFREDFDEEPQLDKPSTPPSDITFDQLVANTTEGVLWTDPDREKYRTKQIAADARLLKSFIAGLNRGGYPEKQTKDAMREEFESILDDLVLKSSYAAWGLWPVIARTMHAAGLNNFRTGINWVRRFKRAVQSARA